MNGADFVPPYEIFLAAAIIALFAIIPIIFVIKDSTRLRQSLIAKRDGETQPQPDEINSTVEE